MAYTTAWSSQGETPPWTGRGQCQEETIEAGEMDGFSGCRGIGDAQAHGPTH